MLGHTAKPRWLFLSSKELTPDPICAADKSKRRQPNPGNRTRRANSAGKCRIQRNSETDGRQAHDAIHVPHFTIPPLRDTLSHLKSRTAARRVARSRSGYFFRAKSLRPTQYAPPITASAGNPTPAIGPGAPTPLANAGFNKTVR